MIRRVNFTRRKRIRREDVEISINEDPGCATFEAGLKLSEYQLPGKARVFIEASRQTSRMRFDFGTVSAITPPRNRRLTEFDHTDGISFRVKVISVENKVGQILAEADKIRLRFPKEKETGRIPLLPVKPEDLEEEIFRVDFSGDPLLLINSSVDDWRSLVQSPVFKALAYPSIFREILTRILRIDEYADLEDNSDWRSQWLKFARELPIEEIPEDNADDEDKEEWIQQAVACFCGRYKLMKVFGDFLIEERTR